MSPFIYLDLILFAFLCVIVYHFYRARRIRINNQILFSFCDLRRELMSLAREEKVDIHSQSFKFYYSFLSNLIHKIRDYKFLSDLFLMTLCQEEATEKLVCSEAVDPEDPAMASIAEKFLNTMNKSLQLADFLFVFKYNFIKGYKNGKQYRQQKREFEDHYHGGSSLRLA